MAGERRSCGARGQCGGDAAAPAPPASAQWRRPRAAGAPVGRAEGRPECAAASSTFSPGRAVPCSRRAAASRSGCCTPTGRCLGSGCPARQVEGRWKLEPDSAQVGPGRVLGRLPPPSLFSAGWASVRHRSALVELRLFPLYCGAFSCWVRGAAPRHGRLGRVPAGLPRFPHPSASLLVGRSVGSSAQCPAVFPPWSAPVPLWPCALCRRVNEQSGETVRIHLPLRCSG